MNAAFNNALWAMATVATGLAIILGSLVIHDDPCNLVMTLSTGCHCLK